MKVLIIVPAFNEEAVIRSVIDDLLGHGYKDILVIDDGSSDKTFQTARTKKVITVSHIVNRGLGASLGTGFTYAKKRNYEALVTFDADGQHRALDISKLLTKIKNGTDVVIGSRASNQKSMPRMRRFLNWSSNFMTFLMTGIWTTDSLSGLRAFNRKAIESVSIKTDRMEVSNEFFKEIGRNKLKLDEVPIKAIYTEYSLTNSKQGRFASIKIGLKLLLRLFR